MDTIDLTQAAAPKSDQTNADDLIGGPMTVQVERVTVNVGGEQPVSIHLVGRPGKPLKPCKTTIRVLMTAWGSDGAKYAGRWMRIYRDPTVKFGGEVVGGIRIEALSDIPRPLNLSLTYTRGKKAAHRIEVLSVPAKEMDLTTFKKWLSSAMNRPENPWTREQIAAELGMPAADVPPDEYAGIVAKLNGPPTETQTGPVNPLDLGWTADQLDSLRPGEAELIVRELRTADEWKITLDLMLVRR